jgi:hypothetical protein
MALDFSHFYITGLLVSKYYISVTDAGNNPARYMYQLVKDARDRQQIPILLIWRYLLVIMADQ